MFKEILDELKKCSEELQSIGEELQLTEEYETFDTYQSCMIRACIESIENISNKICDISDNCRITPIEKEDDIHSAHGIFFKTAKHLLQFLGELSERDLGKPIKIGKNEWDDDVYMGEVARIYNVDWVRNDETEVLICCK